jgi:hypothetical protein
MSRLPTKELPSLPVKRRSRFKQTLPLEERLALQARHDRDRARALPPGTERDELLRHAERAESASQLTAWLAAPERKLK